MENEMTRTKLLYFKDNKISIHIGKKDGRFNNGLVLEVAGDMLILDDEKFGAFPIMFEEINFIEKREVKNDGKGTDRGRF